MSRASPLLAAALAAWLDTLAAQAQVVQVAHDAIRLEIPDCEGVSGSHVRELVALELAPHPVLEASQQPAQIDAPTTGGLRCARGVAQIWVEDRRRGPALHLEITLNDLAPQTRPRLLALALSELIATSRLLPVRPALSAQPSAAIAQPTAAVATAAPVAPQPPSLATTPTRASTLQLWLGLGAVAEADPRLIAPAIGVGGVIGWDQLALAVDLRAERGARSVETAELSLATLSLALGPAWRVHGRSVQWLLGPAVRAGYAVLHASARTPESTSDTLTGFWLGPCAQTSLQVRVAQHWLLRAGVEFGYATQAVRGLDSRGDKLLELADPWLSVHAGVAWEAH